MVKKRMKESIIDITKSKKDLVKDIIIKNNNAFLTVTIILDDNVTKKDATIIHYNVNGLLSKKAITKEIERFKLIILTQEEYEENII